VKPKISQKAIKLRRSKSLVREIMTLANPNHFKRIGFNRCDIISFAGGWVNHKSPEALKDAYLEIIRNEDLFHQSGGYPPTLGTYECKRAIVKFKKHLYCVKNLDTNQIAIGANSTQLVYDLMQVLLEDGDKILLLDPTYCNYPLQILSSLKVHLIRFPVLNKDSWVYMADEKIQELSEYIIKNKPKVIMLVSPDNPTSQVLSDEFVQSALNAAREIGSFLIIDFAYREIFFKEQFPDYFSWEPNENFISINSNSKWGRSLGRRLGWIEAPEFIIESIESFLNSSILCPDMLHQMAFTKYVDTAIKENSLKPYLRDTSRKYQLAAQRTVSSIKKHLGFPYLNPQGGLYTCIKVGMNSAKFVEDVLKQTGVLFVPGWGFGRTLYEGVRVSFGPLVDNLNLIEKGIERVGRFLAK